MKIVTTALIIIAFVVLIQIWLPKEKELNNPVKLLLNTEPCFEIKVVFEFIGSDDEENYEIFFTNDGWATKETLLFVYDASNLEWYSTEAWTNAGNKQEAIETAKKFTSYEECVDNNIKVNKAVITLIDTYKKRGIPSFQEYQDSKKLKFQEPAEKEIIITNCK